MNTLQKTSVKSALLLSALMLAPVAVAGAQQKPFSLQKKWSLEGFEAPESVCIDPSDGMLYISNINGEVTDKDANGYITKVSPEGKLLAKKWIEGLDAPKGIAIRKGKMYVADIDRIVEIDMAQRRIVGSYSAPGATFLNDLTIDQKGKVYASNTFGGESIIFRLSKGKVTPWLHDDRLNLPNGLLARGKYIYVTSWGEDPDPTTFRTKSPGKALRVSLRDKSIEVLIDGLGNMDGLAETLHGMLATDWISGALVYIKASPDTQMYHSVNVLTLRPGSADIAFSKTDKKLYVPLMMDGRLEAYAIDSKRSN